MPARAACAPHLAKHLRHALEVIRFDVLPSTHRVTASFGVAALRPGESLEDLPSRADTLLDAAKREGRNCVTCERDLPQYRIKQRLRVA